MVKRLVVAVCVLALLLVAAIGAAGLLYETDLSIPAGMAGTHVEAGGVRLRVLQEGSGRDVLMIHGSPGMLEDFDPVAQRLRETFRITRYDRAGHGFSEDAGNYSLRFHAATALALIERLALERVVVVGHSFGGSTALALALENSPRVSAVVVLDSAVYEPIRQPDPLFRVLRLPVIGIGLARVVPQSRREATVAASIAREFAVAVPPEPFLSLRASVFGQPKVLHAIANEHTSNAAELAALSPGYREVEVPVHVVAQRDHPARKATAERLHAELPRGELRLVSPSGHYVQLEQPDAVAEVIRAAAESGERPVAVR